MLPGWCLLLARAWVGRDLGGQRVYRPTPAGLVRGAQWQVAFLEVAKSQHCRTLVLEGKLVLVLG